MKKLRGIILLALFVVFTSTLAQAAKPLTIYIEADWSGTQKSSEAIFKGISTALYEVNYAISGHPIVLKKLDHRGNTLRSKANLEKIANDPDTLAVFCGQHSPPIISALDFINKNELLLLDPWAAGAPITRSANPLNWLFRVSLDDSKAAHVISAFAVKHGAKKPHLFLERTGWGKSNEKSFAKAFQKLGISAPDITWFDLGLNNAGARIIIRDVIASDADSIFLVASPNESVILAKAMYELKREKLPPIYSHWGLTGGTFTKDIPHYMRENLNINFIQTKFSFLTKPMPPYAQKVFEHAQKLFPEIKTPYDIHSPIGFIHAYDAMKILIAAIKQAGLSDDTAADKRRIRDALESLNTPVRGLIKEYNKPFSPYNEDSPDAHEALTIDDLTMATFGAKNEIILQQ